MNILIYGIGNPYRCDDRVGIEVAEILRKKIKTKGITIKSGSLDGLAMLDEITGYEKVIFVDSIRTENGTPGDIYRITLDPLDESLTISVSHGVDFVNALRMGKRHGYKMPKEIVVYAAEIQDNESFREECTEKVAASIPEMITRISKEIHLLERL